MGFGGGSSGLGSPPAIFRLVGSYAAAIAELTTTFTIPTALQNPLDVAGYLIIIDGSATAALTLNMRYNTLATAFYNSLGSRQISNTGVVTDLAGGFAVSQLLADATAIAGANNPFNGKVYVELQSATGTEDDNVAFQSEIVTWDNTGVSFYQSMAGGRLNQDVATLTSLTILASANWNIGTKITMYALMRA